MYTANGSVTVTTSTHLKHKIDSLQHVNTHLWFRVKFLMLAVITQNVVTTNIVFHSFTLKVYNFCFMYVCACMHI